jgi:hypothetical protein
MVWQSAKSAPKDGTRILVAEHDGHVSIAEWSRSHWIRDGTCRGVDFTHWMPLPEPPSRKKRTFRVLFGKEANN